MRGRCYGCGKWRVLIFDVANGNKLCAKCAKELDEMIIEVQGRKNDGD